MIRNFAILSCFPALLIAQAPIIRPAMPSQIHRAGFKDGRFQCRGMTALSLIAMAWAVPEWTVHGGPGWVASARWDIDSPGTLKEILADHFGVTIRQDTRQTAVYALVVDEGGFKLLPSQDPPFGRRLVHGRFEADHISPADIASFLATQVRDRPVVDMTGITGKFDIRLDWKPEGGAPDPDLLAALRDQAGLKLEPRRIPVAVLVVEHARKP